MKQLLRSFALLLCCLFAFADNTNLQAQTISIGNGTATDSPSPWDPWYGYSYTQTIYLASEINASGNITSITFDYAGSSLSNSNNVVVYMGTTTKSSFASTSDWVPVSALTQVYSGVLTGYTAPGLVTITLSTPFPYDPSQNLVIAVDENKAGYDVITRFKATNVVTQRTLTLRNDNTNPDPSNLSAGQLSTAIGNIRINGLTASSCSVPSGISFTNLTSTSVDVSWNAPSRNAPAQYNWEMRTSGAAGSGSTGLIGSGTTTSTAVTINSVTAGTQYYFYVRSDCGGGNFSLYGNSVLTYTCQNIPLNTPYYLDFEGPLTNQLPQCTATGDRTNVFLPDWNVEYLSNNFQSNVLKSRWISYSGWYFTQAINLTGGKMYHLSFDFGNTTDYAWTNFEFKFGKSPTIDSMTGLIVNYPDNTHAVARASSSTYFTPLTSGVYYVGIHHPIGEGSILVFDNIAVSACDPPVGISIDNITATSANVSWNAPSVYTASQYSWEVRTSGAPGSGSTGLIASGTTASTAITVNNLTIDKFYFYIKSDCGGGEYSIYASNSFSNQCRPPSDIVFAGITNTSVNVSWNAPSSGPAPTGYSWEMRTSGAAGSGSTGLIASGTTVSPNTTFTNALTPGTTYSFYVRSTIGTTNLSDFAQNSFATCQVANVPYSQDFEGVTVPGLPSCTSVMNAGTGKNWVTSNVSSNCSSKTLKYSYSSDAANTWFYTQGLNLTAGTSYRLAFKYGADDAAFTEKLEVKYGTTASPAGMTNSIVNYPNIQVNGTVNTAADFTPATLGVYYIGFHAYSDPGQLNLYVDDISVTVAPTAFYRSKASGNWSDRNTWEVSSDNVNWEDAGSIPTVYATEVTVRNGHTVTVTANATARKPTVKTGGTLTVKPGVVLTTQ